jgi:methylated-DNA-[protein]-cysteine S-methyltransferase
MYTHTFDTPPGPFTVIVDEDGAVLGSGWTDDAEILRVRIADRLRPAALRSKRDVGAAGRAVGAYFRGDLSAINDVTVVQEGGTFITQAWKVLREVGPGAPITYAEFADLAGRPRAVRAAASACAQNSAALFVPCHRIVRTGGGLGGFRWGLGVKQWLLDHEAAEPTA